MKILYKQALDIQQQIEKGIFILRQGGIIAFPTDTVYGLGAGASIPQAIKRVYEVSQGLEGLRHAVQTHDTADQRLHVDAAVGDGAQRLGVLLRRVAQHELQVQLLVDPGQRLDAVVFHAHPGGFRNHVRIFFNNNETYK